MAIVTFVTTKKSLEIKMKYTKHIISAIATAISIISPIFSSSIPPYITYIIIAIGLFCFVFLLYDGIKNNMLNERICTSKQEIEDAMKDIIKSEDNICIMSRDLTWVTSEIAACLIDKKENCLIFVQHKNDITKKLINGGVRIKYYGDLKFVPQTRFTIIRYNRKNPQVAIANVENNIRKKRKIKHTIYQTSSNGKPQDDWINSLALDLIHLCDEVCKEDHNVKKK